MARRLIVTGAGSGIGAATSRRAVDAGWSVAGIDRAFPVDSGPAGHTRFTVDDTAYRTSVVAPRERAGANDLDAACAEGAALPTEEAARRIRSSF